MEERSPGASDGLGQGSGVLVEGLPPRAAEELVVLGGKDADKVSSVLGCSSLNGVVVNNMTSNWEGSASLCASREVQSRSKPCMQ